MSKTSALERLVAPVGPAVEANKARRVACGVWRVEVVVEASGSMWRLQLGGGAANEMRLFEAGAICMPALHCTV